MDVCLRNRSDREAVKTVCRHNLFCKGVISMVKNRNMKPNRWNDYYARRAKAEKWRARSVYKFKEINDKFNLIHEGNSLLDLGCYPGSWSQFGITRVGPEGRVVGIDLKPPEHFTAPNFIFIQADVLMLDIDEVASEIGPMDLVISDLAPKTTGIRETDTARSISLAEKAYEISVEILKNRGRFLCKVFEGAGFSKFKEKVSARFKQVRLKRPKATRKASREIYIVGLDFKQEGFH